MMESIRLQRLTAQGMAALDEQFLEGTPSALPEDGNFVIPIEELAPVLASNLSIRVSGSGKLGPDDDPKVATLLHETLPIRRGVATDTRFWAWLAACHLPDVVRRRWVVGARAPNRGRFAGNLTTNALSRLWWAAELTADHGKVDPVRLAALLAGQYRVDRLLSTPVMRQPHVLRGLLDAIGDDLRWQVLSEMCQRVGVLATTYSLSAMSSDEVMQLVRRVYQDVIEKGEFGDAADRPSEGA